MLTSEDGLLRRSRRPIEPEAVFGQMKYDKQYKRFRHTGKAKVHMDLGVFFIAFNLQKMIRRMLRNIGNALSRLYRSLLGTLWTITLSFLTDSCRRLTIPVTVE
jgi:hypothetical protein